MNFGIDEKLFEDALRLYSEDLCTELPAAEECTDISFSPDFQRRMEKLIKDRQKFYYYWFNTVGKRIASIVLIVVIGLLTVTFSVKALREPFLKFIVEIFEKFTSIVMVQEEPKTATTFVPMDPTYLPKGFVVESEIEYENNYRKKYRNEHGLFITYRQQLNKTFVTTIDTENIEYNVIFINGLQGFKYINKGEVIITFSDSNYTYILMGPISESELLRMAESIFVK